MPVGNVLGAIDDGWTVAKYLLGFERGGSAYAPALRVHCEELQRHVLRGAQGARALPDDAAFAARLAEVGIEIEVLDALEMEILGALSQSSPAGADASMMKILGTELQQRLTELALEAAGPLARAWQPGVAMAGGPVLGYPGEPIDDCSGEPWQAIAPLRYLNERAGSIYAGTNEIQRGILAKAVFGF